MTLRVKEYSLKECKNCGFKSNTSSCPRCGTKLETEMKTLVIRDENLRGGFAQVPNVVIRNPLLSSNAVRLYTLLLSYAWQTHECFPGQEVLSRDMGCNRTTITRTLAELRKHHLITWHRRGQGKVNIYYIERLDSGYMPIQFVDKGNMV